MDRTRPLALSMLIWLHDLCALGTGLVAGFLLLMALRVQQIPGGQATVLWLLLFALTGLVWCLAVLVSNHLLWHGRETARRTSLVLTVMAITVGPMGGVFLLVGLPWLGLVLAPLGAVNLLAGLAMVAVLNSPDTVAFCQTREETR